MVILRFRLCLDNPTLPKITAVATDRPACARLSADAPAGLLAASYTTSRDTTFNCKGGGKGNTYGTLVVDLERRQVVDLLGDRSAARTTRWFKEHPEVEMISRDRCSLYAQGASQGAPQARQVRTGFTCFKTCGNRFSSS